MTRLSLCFGVVTLSVASLALARPGNPERYPMGANATGMGGAAIAHGVSSWFNPASLGTVSERSMSASLSAYGYTHDSVPRYVRSANEIGLSGKLTNDALEVFPASVDFLKPLGALGPLRHGVGVSLIIPDFDQFDGVLEMPASEAMLEVRARVLAEDRTYWVTPAWGACLGDWLCFGAGPTGAVRVQERVQILTLLSDFGGVRSELSQTSQSRMVVLTLGGQVGMLLRPLPSLSFGLTIRSPMTPVHSTGELLNVVSVADNTGLGESYIDRVETLEPQLDYRLPWRFGVGVAFRPTDWLLLAADARISLAVDPYRTVAGPNGEAMLQPSTPSGPIEDIGRAITVEQYTSMRPAVNFNVGAGIDLGEDLGLQVGAFTDLTATPKKNVLEYREDRLSRIGATASFAWTIDPVSTWVGVVYAHGWGEVPGLGTSIFDSVEADLTSQTFLVMLGSKLEM